MVNAVQEGPPFDGASWNPPLEAIESVSVTSGDEQPILRVLTHPDAPYLRTEKKADWCTFLEVAHDYVKAATNLDVHPRFELEPGWLHALDPGARRPDPYFGWMDVRGLDEHGKIHMPLGSLETLREKDGWIVLFATERLGAKFFRGSEFGLRVALRWRTDEHGSHFSIIGMSAVLPFGIYKTLENRVRAIEDLHVDMELFFLEIASRMAVLADLDGPATLRGVRVVTLGGRIQVEGHGVGTRLGLDQVQIPYAVSTVTRLDGEKVVDTLLARNEFFADADGDARVFKTVPPLGRAYRVRRDEEVLDGERESETIEKNKAKPSLVYKDNLQVIPCPRFVRADAGLYPPLAVSLPDNDPPGVRSDAASAVQGLRFGRDFLIRMESYGLVPTAYFELINPKLDIAYRSFVSPGPGKDGQTVNARVLPLGWPPSMIGPVAPESLPVVQVHLALADCARRERNRWKPGDPRQPAIPMGIAADERWLWHEFGHILTLASTGELELRFAHSPGDALAAIVGDPELASGEASSQWRGATFPWVYLPRRHDRCVLGGWSWCGSMHKSLAQVLATEHPRRKGYLSEQILSSSLFRLYRCIGGDTLDKDDLHEPDRQARRAASHYTTFLVMQALRVLGDAKVVPAMDPIQLEQALVDADLFEIEWIASYLPFGEDASETQTYRRVGGCSTKVIRWAFEAQGLHAPMGSGHDHNKIGAPRPVDVFIRSCRQTTDPGFQSAVDFGPGSYVPTSLHWQKPGSAAPDWQADPDAGIVWRADRKFDVWVGNRGTANEATGVTVSVWAAEWPAAQAEPPKWNAGTWVPCPPATSPPKKIATGATKRFGPFDFHPVAGRRYAVVAVADGPGDRALIRMFDHACSFTPTPLIDIVPNDNNMGLLVIQA